MVEFSDFNKNKPESNLRLDGQVKNLRIQILNILRGPKEFSYFSMIFNRDMTVLRVEYNSIPIHFSNILLDKFSYKNKTNQNVFYCFNEFFY